MKSINLQSGLTLLIDDEDYEYVSQFHWWAVRGRGTWYAVRQFTHPETKKRTTVYLHRVLMGPLPKQQIDHVDGNGLNNRRENLRVCTHAENQRNSVSRKAGKTSRFKGVHWNTRRRMWHVQIHVNNQNHYVGSFASEEEAASAYDTAARLHHGEFALLNGRE